MHDELVKRLREDVPKALSNFDFDSVEDWIKVEGSIKEAADAIEELQKCLDGVEADNDSLCATIEKIERDLKRSKEYEAFWEKEANEALKKFQMAIANPVKRRNEHE